MQNHLNTLIVATSVAVFALLAAPIAGHYAGFELAAVGQAAESGHDHTTGSTGQKGKGKSSSQKGESHSKEGHKSGSSAKGGTSHDTSTEGASKSLEGKVFSTDTGHGSDKSHKGKGPKYMGGGKGGEDDASGHDTGADTEHVK